MSWNTVKVSIYKSGQNVENLTLNEFIFTSLPQDVRDLYFEDLISLKDAIAIYNQQNFYNCVFAKLLER